MKITPKPERFQTWPFFRLGVSLCLAFILAGCVSPSGGSDSGSAVPLDDQLNLPEAETRALVGVTSAKALAAFSRGLQYELRGEFSSAIDLYREAIELQPDNDALYMMASQRLLQNDRTEDAFDLMETLRERHPDNPRTLRWLSHLYLETGKQDKALPLLKELAAQGSERESVYLMATQLLLQKGQVDEAMDIARLGTRQAESSIRISQVLLSMLLEYAEVADDLASSDRYRTEAEALIQSAMDKHPEAWTFVFQAAELRLNENRLADAYALLADAEKREGGTLEFRMAILAQLIQGLGGGPEGFRTVSLFLEEIENPTVMDLFLRAQMLEVVDRSDEALEVFQRAANMNPEDVATQYVLAVKQIEKEKYDRAASMLARVVEQQPDDPELLRMTGHVELFAERFEEAEARFNHLLLMQRQGKEIGSLEEIYTYQSMALLALGKAEAAVDAMTKALSLNPESLDQIWAHQISLAFRERDTQPEKAKEREALMLETLYDLSDRLPDHPQIETRIGITYNVRREFSEAIAAFERAELLAKDRSTPSLWLNADFYFEWGNALERNGMISEAITSFETAIDIDPRHHRSLNYVAYMWAERAENLPKALDYVQRALALEPGNGSYLDTLGWVYYQQGRFEEALRELEKAAESEPMESVIIEHLGDVMLKLERPVEAAGYYRIALELDPGDRQNILEEQVQKALNMISDIPEQP